MDVGEEILLQRAVKTPEEIDYIKQAIFIAEEAFRRSLGSIKPGVSEKEFVAELEYQARKLGSEGWLLIPLWAAVEGCIATWCSQ